MVYEAQIYNTFPTFIRKFFPWNNTSARLTVKPLLYKCYFYLSASLYFPDTSSTTVSKRLTVLAELIVP